jgi:hypothetical protein
VLLFLDGVLMAMFLVSGAFFLRYWRSSGDRLYALFALAFLILGANRVLLAHYSHAIAPVQEHHVLLYSVRLAAFVIILVAILDKNRSESPVSKSL